MFIELSMRFFLPVYEILKNWIRHSKANKAAIIAFYTLFSFAPLVFLTANILGYFFSDLYIEKQVLAEADSLIGYETSNLVKIFLSNKSTTGTGSISFLTLVFLYSSSIVFS